jgi:hypothetical protein
MTTSALLGSGRPLNAALITRHFWNAPSRRVTGRRRQIWGTDMTTSAGTSGQRSLLASAPLLLASPPGAIGGAVINAARCSASLSIRQLARKMSVGPAIVRSWESGIFPLFCVRYDQLRRLAEVLSQRQADTGLVLDELLLAGQCDLLVTGMLRGTEDYPSMSPVRKVSMLATCSAGR